ncbi:bifunctional oligoribonuclease/PAP phosphatase NrnA [Candidatus Omnitrophota bacterium]
MTAQIQMIHQQIRDKIDAAKTISVSTHIDPDGDAVGSVLALESFLRRKGKNVIVACHHRVPDMYLFLGKEWTPINLKNEYEHIDCAIIFDCPTRARSGNAGKLFSDDTCIVNVDHHVSNTHYGDVNLVDTTASSCGELLFDLLDSYGASIDKFEKECVFVAISTDTGSFRYSNIRPRTFEIASRFIQEGVDIATLNQHLYASCPLKKFKLLQDFFSKVEIDVERKIGWCILTQEMFDALVAKKSDTEGFIDFIRDISEVEIALVLFEVVSGKTKVSFRSKSECDVNIIAMKFGGGGHVRAAGCTVDASPEKALELILQAIEDVQ